MAGLVDIYLPGHDRILRGQTAIVDHLKSRILRLKSLKGEILETYYASKEKKILKITKSLSRESPLFRSLMIAHYPRSVSFPQALVAVALKEEGVLT